MALQKVKAVTEASGERGDGRKARQQDDGRWSAHFLELLLHEFEEEEREERKPPKQRREKEKNASLEGNEEDRRIIVKGEGEVPPDWDSFEVTRDFTEPVLTSELYEDIIDSVKSVGNWQANILYKIAGAIMQDYYTQALSYQAVGELFYECYQKCVENRKNHVMPGEKKQEILEILYEYFSRVNARKSVAANEREGRAMIERCGLHWAGTTYYDSSHYYEWKHVQQLFSKLCKRIAQEEELCALSFADLCARTQFSHVGGLTFHSMFIWVQKKDNHPGNQYGMRQPTRVPPLHFRYLYRNHFAKNEKTGILLLESKMKQESEMGKYLWRSFTLEDGREYHNGMSYLLEGSILDEQDDTVYGETMAFLQNFILYRVSGCVEFLLVKDAKEEQAL